MNNRDLLLGVLLIVVVSTSLFLSHIAWWRLYDNIDAIEAETTVLKTVDLASVIAPGRAVLHFGQDIHSVVYPYSPLYGKIWEFVKNILSEGEFTGVKNPINPESFRQKKGLELFFSTPLPVDFLTKVFNMREGQQAIPHDRLAGSIIIVEDNGLSVFLKGTGNEFYSLKNKEDSSELRQLLEQVVAENPRLYTYLPPAKINVRFEEGIYVPVSDDENDLFIFTFKREKKLGQSGIAKFFPDFSITRRIEEKDGAVIYTDGNRGLRIYPDGALEYSRPVPSDSKLKLSFYEALSLAVNFINTHGGWPGEAYLSSYKTSKAQGTVYTFNFGVRVRGLPLLGQNYITVTVEGNQVSRYYRKIVREDRILEKIQPISPIQALDAAIATGNLKEVKSLDLAYVIFENTLSPVWAVKSTDVGDISAQGTMDYSAGAKVYSQNQYKEVFINAKNGVVINLQSGVGY
ncbi:MAG: two-component system activity regulator YycH [Thermosediminibacteraceae bacterium]|nr:two-component system activity regulator YycH [Thermosediminibacteraceae bacterium]